MTSRTLEEVGEALIASARKWGEDACLLGNVRAEEIDNFVLRSRVLMTTVMELAQITSAEAEDRDSKIAELSRNMGHFAGAIGTAAGLRDVGFKAPEQIVHAVHAQAARIAELETRAEAPADDSMSVQVAQARALVSLWRQRADRAERGPNTLSRFVFRECAQELEDALNWKKAKP